MNNSEIYPNVATELVEIFKFVEESVLEKIPDKLKEELKKASNEEHNFEIDKSKKLDEQEMLPETKELLSAIFVKYCCRKEDGEEILLACKENDIKAEERKREIYNPNDVFKIKGDVTVVQPKEVGKFQLVVVDNSPWYKKLFRRIRNFFRTEK